MRQNRKSQAAGRSAPLLYRPFHPLFPALQILRRCALCQRFCTPFQIQRFLPFIQTLSHAAYGLRLIKDGDMLLDKKVQDPADLPGIAEQVFRPAGKSLLLIHRIMGEISGHLPQRLKHQPPPVHGRFQMLQRHKPLMILLFFIQIISPFLHMGTQRFHGADAQHIVFRVLFSRADSGDDLGSQLLMPDCLVIHLKLPAQLCIPYDFHQLPVQAAVRLLCGLFDPFGAFDGHSLHRFPVTQIQTIQDITLIRDRKHVFHLFHTSVEPRLLRDPHTGLQHQIPPPAPQIPPQRRPFHGVDRRHHPQDDLKTQGVFHRQKCAAGEKTALDARPPLLINRQDSVGKRRVLLCIPGVVLQSHQFPLLKGRQIQKRGDQARLQLLHDLRSRPRLLVMQIQGQKEHPCIAHLPEPGEVVTICRRPQEKVRILRAGLTKRLYFFRLPPVEKLDAHPRPDRRLLFLCMGAGQEDQRFLQLQKTGGRLEIVQKRPRRGPAHGRQKAHAAPKLFRPFPFP